MENVEMEGEGLDRKKAVNGERVGLGVDDGKGRYEGVGWG
jgi:hypothetical protein